MFPEKIYYNNETLVFCINLTLLCNMQCKYCVEQTKKINSMNIEYIYRFIDFIEFVLNSEFFKKQYKYICITFYGGEPTIKKDYIEIIYNYFKNNEKVAFYLLTNGINISSIYDILLDSLNFKNKITISLSYDGKEINDKYRIRKDGLSSSDEVLDVIDKLYKDNIPFWLKPTVPLDCLHLIYDAYKEYSDLELKYPNKKFYYMYTIDYNELNYRNYNINEIDLKLFKEQLYKVFNDEIKRIEEDKEPIFFKQFVDEYFILCRAGTDNFYLSTDGYFYRCHFDENDPLLRISHIEKNNSEILQNIAMTSWYFKNMNKKSDKLKCDCIIPKCLACTSKNIQFSKKHNFEDKYYDFKNNEMYCSILKLISKTTLAFDYIKRRKQCQI